MKKLDWYIFKKYLGTFFFSISLLIIIVIVFDVSENIDSFIKNEATFREVVYDYYIPFIPYFINLFIYLFVFISVIFFTSKMAGHTEIIAILSSGISFKRFLLPYVMAAVLLSIGVISTGFICLVACVLITICVMPLTAKIGKQKVELRKDTETVYNELYNCEKYQEYLYKDFEMKLRTNNYESNC